MNVSNFLYFSFYFLLYSALDTAYDGVGVFVLFFGVGVFFLVVVFPNIFKFLVQFLCRKGHFLQCIH